MWFRDQNLLPIGLAEGCRLKKDIPKDQVLTYEDVEIPKGAPVRQAAERAGRIFSLIRKRIRYHK